jgi:GntR family transcriptional regulator, sialic acid-inducible nan operon repressor
MIDPLVIERKKLFEHVASHLEAQILSGKLKPGDQLPPERDLQSRFGVGRPAIREALISLQRAGLVELTNGARARVVMPTASQIFTGMAPAVRQMVSTEQGQRSFQGARMFFEVGLAREAARTATSEDLQMLREALETNRLAIGDRDRFTSTDIAFHFELARIARNVVFIALHDQMSEWLKEQRIVTLAVSGQEETAYQAHRAIYEGIAARDPDRAEQAMRAHLEQLTMTFWRQRSSDHETSDHDE